MTAPSRTHKVMHAVVTNPTAILFFLLDRFHDRVVLPTVSPLWRAEAILRGASVGRGAFLGRPTLKLHPLSKVTLGSGFALISDQRRCNSGNLYAPCRIHTHSATASVIVGDGVGLNGTSIVARSRSIRIGDNTQIAPNCVIMDSPFHRSWPPSARQTDPGLDLDEDVSIGANCWIGAGCVILPGARIGDNSVVGARSVVTGEIPAKCLAIGSPARVVRSLDSNG